MRAQEAVGLLFPALSGALQSSKTPGQRPEVVNNILWLEHKNHGVIKQGGKSRIRAGSHFGGISYMASSRAKTADLIMGSWGGGMDAKTIHRTSTVVVVLLSDQEDRGCVCCGGVLCRWRPAQFRVTPSAPSA